MIGFLTKIAFPNKIAFICLVNITKKNTPSKTKLATSITQHNYNYSIMFNTVHLKYVLDFWPAKCLILLWSHLDINITLPKIPLCGGGCEITQNRSRFNESLAVVFMMKKLVDFDLPDPELRSVLKL